MKNNILFKNILKMILIIFIAIPIILFFLDYSNISLINITKDYDWLAFIGAYMGSIATLCLGIVSYKQNEELKKANDMLDETNKKMYEDNLKILGFLNTDFAKEQYLYTIYDDDGFKLIPKDEMLKQLFDQEYLNSKSKKGDMLLCSGDHNNLRFIINVIVKNHKNIESFYFDNMQIDYNNEGNKEHIIFANNENSYANIEKEEQNRYNMTIILYAPKSIIKKIEESSELTLTFDLKLKNCSGVVTPSWNEIVINKNGKINGDRILYDLHNRKNVGRPPRTKYGEVFYRINN